MSYSNQNWAATWQNQQSDCAPSEDSDQPGHLPSLIRVFAVRMKKAWVLSYPLSTQQRLWSNWADAWADLSLRWVHSHFVGFVMSWLRSSFGAFQRCHIRRPDFNRNEEIRFLPKDHLSKYYQCIGKLRIYIFWYSYYIGQFAKWVSLIELFRMFVCSLKPIFAKINCRWNLKCNINLWEKK